MRVKKIKQCHTKKLHPDDHSEYRWLSFEEIDENIKDRNDKEYAAVQKGFKLLENNPVDLARS